MNKHLVFLTGSTGLIGHELESRLLDDGHLVISTARSYGLSNQTVDGCFFYKCDLNSTDEIESMLKRVHNDGHRPTALINAARSLDNAKWTSSLDISKFENELKLNVVIPYYLSCWFAEQAESKLKHIVNISSIYGSVVPHPNLYPSQSSIPPISYGVSKSALNQMTKELAIRLIKRKISVNSIAYGGIKGRASLEFQEDYSRFSPSGKMMELSEVYNVVKLILASDHTLTGQVLSIDGGWTLC